MARFRRSRRRNYNRRRKNYRNRRSVRPSVVGDRF